MVSSVDTVHGSGMIALPALGLMRTGRINRALLQTVGTLHGSATSRRSGADDTATSTYLRSPEHPIAHSDTGLNTYETLKGFRGRMQLLAGMVRGSRPWRILPGLSGVMAAATATGSFGVFYTSIWSMADYLSSARLASISLLSIAIMTIWLIAHNDLWERPVVGGRRAERRVSYNLATVITMLLAVAAMYVGLFAAIFGGALIVINSDYLAVQLGHPVSITEYRNLAWLSASLGTIAGALGSSLDNEQAVKRATFSSREYDRRQLSKNREKASGRR